MGKPKSSKIEMEDAEVMPTDWIAPIVRVEGQKHELVKLIEEDEAPVMKAVGYMKLLKGRQHSWCSYLITFKGNKILKCEIAEPDMRAVAEEAAKADFVEQLMDPME